MSENKMEYFIRQTNERLDKIDEKLDALLAFKWQLVGASIFFSSLVSFFTAEFVR